MLKDDFCSFLFYIYNVGSSITLTRHFETPIYKSKWLIKHHSEGDDRTVQLTFDEKEDL